MKYANLWVCVVLTDDQLRNYHLGPFLMHAKFPVYLRGATHEKLHINVVQFLTLRSLNSIVMQD